MCARELPLDDPGAEPRPTESRSPWHRQYECSSAFLLAFAWFWVISGTLSYLWGSSLPAGLIMIFLAIVLGIGAMARSAQEESAVGITNGPRRLWLILAALILLHGSVAFVIAKNWLPVIDTYTFQWDVSNNLAHGIDPYGATQVDLYGRAPSTMLRDGAKRPRTSWLSLPAPVAVVGAPGIFFGDVRSVYILAVMISASLLFRMYPNARSLGTAALLLLKPFTFFVEM